jgi:hypothetical protein
VLSEIEFGIRQFRAHSAESSPTATLRKPAPLLRLYEFLLRATFTLITVFLLTTLGICQSAQQPIPSEGTHYPRLLHAELPLYPPLTSALRISGKVEIDAIVEKGSVVDAQVKSAEIYISDPQKDVSVRFPPCVLRPCESE